MKPFQPWQDAVTLLSGARPHRTPRPGEQFEEADETPRQSPQRRLWLLICQIRLRLSKPMSGKCQAQSESPVVPAASAYRKRYL